MGFDSYWPPESRPLPADGIKARSRRGRIGDTWWSQRFIAVLESFQMGARLQRGKRYARSGQVLDLKIGQGQVTASVQGSRARPYRVVIGVDVLGDDDWHRVEDALAAKAVFAAKLLAGEMPHDVEEAFAQCRLSLFPRTPDDLDTACSCPDWANPCKHVAATYFLLAEAFDTDPFLIFAWRGRARDELLDALRLRRGGSASTATGGGTRADVDDRDGWPVFDTAGDAGFWRVGAGFDDVRIAVRPPAVADALVRRLDPVDVVLRGTTLPDVLRPAYVVMTEEAARRLVGS